MEMAQYMWWLTHNKLLNIVHCLNGAAERNRTSDLLITNQLLYP